MKRNGRSIVVASLFAVVFLFISAASDAAMVLSNDSTYIGNIIILNADSPDPTVNGTALLTVLGVLTGSSSDRYLIKLGPGTYNVGTTTLAMKDYVDIEGSGENVTEITGHPDSAATVAGASNAEIRFLTVRHTGGGTNNAVAIGNDHVGTRITHVTAVASGATNNLGIFIQGNGLDNSVLLRDVIVEVSDAKTGNGGIFNSSGAGTGMLNVIVWVANSTTNIGIINDNAAPIMKEVTVNAEDGTDSTGILNNNNSGSMTGVYATATGASGNNIGIKNTTTTGTGLTPAVPTMGTVRGEAIGGQSSTGIANISCNGKITSPSRFTGVGHNASNTNIGILNNGCSFFFLSANAVAFPPQSGADHYGIKNIDASPKIESSFIYTPAGDSFCSSNFCYGVYSESTGAAQTVKIDSSQIYTAPTAAQAIAIYSGSNVTTYVGNSKLEGNINAALSGAGNKVCFGVYNGSYTGIGTNCQ